MKIGIDIDGVITDIPSIIRSITNDSCHEIHFITYRDNESEVKDLLLEYNIAYKHIHVAPKDANNIPLWKSQKIIEIGVEAVIEDMPEVLASLPDHIHRIWICQPSIYDLKDAINGMHDGILRKH